MLKSSLAIALLFTSIFTHAQTSININGVVTCETAYGVRPNTGGNVYLVNMHQLPFDSAKILMIYPTVWSYYKMKISNRGKFKKRAEDVLSKDYGIKSNRDFSDFQDRAFRIKASLISKIRPTTVDAVGKYKLTIPNDGQYYILFERNVGTAFYLKYILPEDLESGEINYRFDNY